MWAAPTWRRVGPTTATGHQPPFPPIILSCAAAGAEAPFHTHLGRARVLKGVHVSWPHWMQPLEKLPISETDAACIQLSSHTAFITHVEHRTRSVNPGAAMGIVDVVSVFCALPRTRRHLKKRKEFQVRTDRLNRSRSVSQSVVNRSSPDDGAGRRWR